MKSRRNRKTHSLKRGLVTLLAMVMVLSVCFPGLSARATEDTTEESAVAETNAETDSSSTTGLTDTTTDGNGTAITDSTPANGSEETVTTANLTVSAESEDDALGETGDESSTEAENDGTSEIMELTHFEKLMAAETCWDMISLMLEDSTASYALTETELDALMEKVEAMTDDEDQRDAIDMIQRYKDELAGVENEATTLENKVISDITVEQGSSQSVYSTSASISNTSYTITSSDGTDVTNTAGITVSSRNGISLSTSSSTPAGEYTVSLSWTEKTSGGRGQSETTTNYTTSFTVTVTQKVNSYPHVDFRIAATVTMKVLNADGTVTTKTVNGFITNPTTTVYNTSGTEWTDFLSESNMSFSTTANGIKYFNITYRSSTSSDGSDYEYRMQTPTLDTLKVYEGDTLEVTYTFNPDEDGDGVLDEGATAINGLSQTIVISESINECNGTDDHRGFDFVVTSADISSAIENTMLQISKSWNDNDQTALRPTTITVNVMRQAVEKNEAGETVNSGSPEVYMVLTLADDADNATFTMGTGFTKDNDTTVVFSDGYGVRINGLPQSFWRSNSDNTYTYVNCTYEVVEPNSNTSGNDAVYGTLIYRDTGTTDSYIVKLVNTLSYEKLAVEKEWADGNENHAGESVTVTLDAIYGDNEQVPTEWLAAFIGKSSTTFVLNAENDWYAVMGNMPVYYGENRITGFKITETMVSANGQEYTVTSDVYTAADGSKYAVTYSDFTKVSDGVYKITVTNTLQPQTTTITVTKTVNGNMGDHNKAFNFTATLTDGTFNGVTYTIYQKADGDAESTVVQAATMITTDVTTVNFALKHDQYIVFENLPIGANFTVKETDAGSYTTTVEGEAGSTHSVELKEDMESIDFVNNYNVTIDTGITTISYPFILLLSTAIVGAFVLLLCKRRQMEF